MENKGEFWLSGFLVLMELLFPGSRTYNGYQTRGRMSGIMSADHETGRAFFRRLRKRTLDFLLEYSPDSPLHLSNCFMVLLSCY